MKRILSVIVILAILMSFAVVNVCADTSLSISVPFASAPTGSQIAVETDVSIETDFNTRIKYVVGGEVFDTVQSGENKVIAELVDSAGEVIATSNEEVVYGIPYSFDIDSATVYDWQKTATIIDVINRTGMEGSWRPDVNEDYPGHERVARMQSSNGIKPGFNSPTTVYGDTENLVVFEYDINPVRIDVDAGLGDLKYRAVNSSDASWWKPLYFKADGTLQIATTFGTNANVSGNNVSIPYETQKFYNVKIIFDKKNNVGYICIDNVLYSVLNISRLDLELSIANAKNHFYFNFTPGQVTGTNINEMYVDNLKIYNGSRAEVYSNLTFKNDGEIIASKSEITSTDALTIGIDLINEERNVLFAAYVMSEDKEQVNISLDAVDFAETVPVKHSEIILSNLPSDIAMGTYKIAVLIWDKDTLAPLTTVIPFE